MERGKLCRRSIDQCDFPEFCNGTSEFCVPDAKADDFEACNNNTAYCYRGRCRDTDVFCEEIHGKCNNCIFSVFFCVYFFPTQD